jgi:hypothetical protein
MSRLWAISDDNPLGAYRILLAVSSPWQETIMTSLEQAGISSLRSNTLEEAVRSLELDQPEFFIFSDKFSSPDNLSDPLLEYIQGMSAPQRRELFVIFISPTAKTGDSLSAFSQSVNLVLNPDKLENIIPLIDESWTFWKELYQVFIQTRFQLTGKH